MSGTRNWHKLSHPLRCEGWVKYVSVFSIMVRTHGYPTSDWPRSSFDNVRPAASLTASIIVCLSLAASIMAYVFDMLSYEFAVNPLSRSTSSGAHRQINIHCIVLSLGM